MSKSVLSFRGPAQFTMPVQIPLPGGIKNETVNVTFKYRDRDGIKEISEKLQDGQFTNDVDLVLELATGWDLEDKFDRDSLTELDQVNIHALKAIIGKYFSQISAARLGN